MPHQSFKDQNKFVKCVIIVEILLYLGTVFVLIPLVIIDVIKSEKEITANE